MPISTLTADIDQFKTGIGESQVQMKRDGQDLEKQNQEFQMTVADSQISDDFSRHHWQRQEMVVPSSIVVFQMAPSSMTSCF